MAMEIYREWRPETCLGCAGAIRPGDVVVPVDRGWLLCIHCAEDYAEGAPLRAWATGGQGLERWEAPDAS